MFRKKHMIAAFALAGVQLFVFSLSSMSGPHQLQYLGINVACDLLLVLVATL